ncbi:MAG: SGNH/GDSL hydrolase family protein [Phycisphaerae bacterium]|nr:SGNH/GDSL hydrolase family protein [Phycisphaerae bacterium]
MDSNQPSGESVRTARRPNWVARVVLLAAAVVIGAAAVDLGVRLFGIGPGHFAPRRFEPDGRVPFVRLANGPISYQPGARFSSVYDGPSGAPFTTGPVRYSINQYGLRGPEMSMSRHSGVIRIACLGDSFTFGEGVDDAAVYPRRLESLLNAVNGGAPTRPADSAPARYEVLNCGVQGHGTIDEFLYYRMYISKFRPDVVVLGFFLNDAMDGAETIRQNDEWTTDQPLSRLSHISRISEILERSRAADRLQSAYFAAIRESFESPRWSLCKRALTDLRDLTARDGCRLIVAIWPVLWELDGRYPFKDIHGLISAFCAEQGIACVDLLETFTGLDASSLWVHPMDHHPNATAHDRAARLLLKMFVD